MLHEASDEVILFDPQMHMWVHIYVNGIVIHNSISIWVGEAMHFNECQCGIDEFVKGHWCNTMCRTMGLNNSRKGRPWEVWSNHATSY